MIPQSLAVIAKLGFCSKCSQSNHECLFARPFASARTFLEVPRCMFACKCLHARLQVLACSFTSACMLACKCLHAFLQVLACSLTSACMLACKQVLVANVYQCSCTQRKTLCLHARKRPFDTPKHIHDGLEKKNNAFLTELAKRDNHVTTDKQKSVSAIFNKVKLFNKINVQNWLQN